MNDVSMSDLSAMSLDASTMEASNDLTGETKGKFEDFYTIGGKIRSGSYGTVYVTTRNDTGQEYAVKIIDRTKLKKKSDDDGVFREVRVLRDLSDVRGIVSLIDFYIRPTEFHIVQVLAKGGDVFDRLAKRTTFSEEEARNLSRTLLQTMRDMHARKYVHRDLKPENLLLRDDHPDVTGNYHILVADFGFSKKIPSQGMQTRCGTPAFVAPEILVGAPYFQQVDMWSVGVLLFLLIGGYPPFQDDSHRGLFRKIRGADYIFHETYWEHVSIEAKQMIASLLVVNPDYRWTAEQALQCQWISTESTVLSERDLSKALQELRRFNARRKLKSAMRAVHWATTANFWNPDNVTFSQQMKTWDQKDQAVKKKPIVLTFRDIYELKKKVRKGSFATVWECVHRETKDVYAVKIINRAGLKPGDDEAVLNEVAILQSLVHKHIVQLVDFHEEKEYFFLIMEYMTGGDVFDRIVERNHYTEKDARDLVKVLLKAVKLMHDQGVAHRDLKPQNLLLKSKDNDADIKVADFGFARRVHTPQSLTTRCGTPTYVAPEILKNIPHDTQADMWSVGVIVYVLLVGYPPFMEDKQQDLFRKIRSGDYEFFDEDWEGISEEAIELIKGCLQVDPQQRLTAAQALDNPWFLNKYDTRLSSRSLTSSLRGIREKRSRLRTIATAVIWLTRDSKADPVPSNALESVDELPTDDDESHAML